MIESLLKADADLLVWFNNHQTDALDPIIWALTGIPVWAVLLLIFIAWQLSRFGSLRDWKKIVILFLGVALCIGLADRISSGIVKPGVARLRPSHEPTLEGQLRFYEKDNGKVYRGGQYGFVSSHATNSFAVATFLFLIFGATSSASWVFLWPLTFSYTRMYLGVHYPGDILGGMLLGVLIGLFVTYFWRKVLPKHIVNTNTL